jgi:voltage-gated potassium channel
MIHRNENGTVSFGRLNYAIQVLIILSLVSFAVETLPGLSEAQRRYLNWFEVATVAVFTVEYLVRVALARPWTAYAFSFFGIVDLLAILPFYLALGIDMRSLRAFRLLRLLRILKLARYSSALRLYHRAFIIAREELNLFGAAALVVLYLAAVGIYYCEREAQPEAFSSVFACMWWAVTTFTTVGYGDIYPVTTGGRVFTSCILIIGLGIVAVPTGLLASALSKARETE